MVTNSTNQSHPHTHTELCDEGSRLYATALKTGRIARSELQHAPCLVDLGLLHPDPDDAEWLRPVAPTAALTQLLHPIEREIQQRRRLAVELTDAFEPFMAISTQDQTSVHAITVLEGFQRIDAALDRATAECDSEVLTIQPGGGRNPEMLGQALKRSAPLLDRGVHLRSLYQHTMRHSAATLAYLERVGQQVQVRTLEELPDRLIIFDRKVAVIPAGSDRSVALELRHPGLVAYLAAVFEQFWQRGAPLEGQAPYAPPLAGISGVQLTIAQLLVDGHVDEAIARRLGMNVRTCRAHIAKLATSLGSGSRAQLGFLIAQSAILDQDDQGD